LADPATEVPALKLLPFKSRRARPYLYSQDEIQRLLQAARNMVIRSEFLPHMYPCFFGLLAVTGMRLGEAIDLQPQDVDWRQGVLTLRNPKFGRTRLVPLHRSTLKALRAYAEVRDRMHRGRSLPYFFVSSRANRLQDTTVTQVFHKLSRQIGIRQVGARHGPRLHDLRHRFAVETLVRWYRHSPEEVTRKLPVLSTYLGHVSIAGTYWYLSNTPELMTAASALLEARWKGVAQ
jgi:integrase